MNNQQKRSIDFVISKVQDFVTKLYPILYAVDFNFNSANPTESVCGDALKFQARQALVMSALRPSTKKTAEHSSFKPFNIRELQYEVWEDSDAKLQKMKDHFMKIGLTSAPVSAKSDKIPIPVVK